MNINEIESKEELLDLINKGIDKFGVTKKDINEKYASVSISNNKKNNVRIRLLSENEAILKLMVPYGQRQNTHGTYSYPIPYLYSEGKYAIKVYYETYASYTNDFSNNVNTNKALRNINYFSRWNIDKISILNNFYTYSCYGSNLVSLLAQNASHIGIVSKGNGYAITYQDNFNDKLEVRTYVTDYLTYNGSYYQYVVDDFGRLHYKYNKYGNAIPRYCFNVFTNGSRYMIDLASNNDNITCSKSAASQHYGFLPVFSV